MTKLWNLWLRFLAWSKLTDLDGTLSLTSVGLIVVLFRVAKAGGEGTTVDLGALLLGLVAYNYKKHLKAKGTATDVAELKASLSKHSERLNIVENRTNPMNAVTRR